MKNDLYIYRIYEKKTYSLAYSKHDKYVERDLYLWKGPVKEIYMRDMREKRPVQERYLCENRPVKEMYICEKWPVKEIHICEM